MFMIDESDHIFLLEFKLTLITNKYKVTTNMLASLGVARFPLEYKKKTLINISKFEANIYAAYTNSVRLINVSKFLVIYM